ncbi:3-deoxy-D-manno-octulosonic acid transferase [Belliella pelovolcani]|uniref:3-deoxy-D-manno-octulosonic acid transferase n=1 Tax=Belliella pelovolcani TaxID=529505 RepID=A0A1N7JJI0_9BACT|nr:glycosyltransferase N-terminal domain-containing protein [Belliella pelovolcani]SIS49485.1 3-deoxy-D-manno-octulosonic-acid transferase [Belliella pelovolcani]
MKLLYDFSMTLLSILVKLLQNSRPKIRAFVEGRKNTFREIQTFKENTKNPVAWFHVASLGEYEQAKPVIKQLKEEKPDLSIVLTFYSPSGYENVKKKKQEHIDLIIYLPIDTAKNSEKFINLLQPSMVFFVKYDLWANYILEAKKQRIPLFLFSASMREDQVYFQIFGGFFRKTLRAFDHVFTQNERSIDLLRQIKITNCTQTGDTRFDRVSEISADPKSYPEIEAFCKGSKTIVIGSAWEEDMKIWIPWINQASNYKFIIAPHDIHPDQIDLWASQIELPSIKYSSISDLQNESVLFIDNIGMLSSLYQYAYTAYVGGAFGKGLHNILEPLAFKIPVLFGNLKKPKKFPEAKISIDYGASAAVANFEDLKSTMEALEDATLYHTTCQAAEKLVKENRGSAKKIIEVVLKYTA